MKMAKKNTNKNVEEKQVDNSQETIQKLQAELALANKVIARLQERVGIKEGLVSRLEVENDAYLQYIAQLRSEQVQE